MIEIYESQRAASASFPRGAIFASILVIAVPAFISVGVTDQIGSEPHQEIVDINVYPWSSIGKVGNSIGGACTGVVIGTNQFLTAAHCLYNRRARRFIPAGSIHILLGYEKGDYRVHRIASRYTVPLSLLSLLDGSYVGDRNDVAVVYTDEPFPPDIRPLRLASVTPSPGRAIKTGGFSAGRSQMMTADQRCRIKAIFSKEELIAHDCVTHHGDSGAPLLSIDGDEAGLILGIIVQAGVAISAVRSSNVLFAPTR